MLTCDGTKTPAIKMNKKPPSSLTDDSQNDEACGYVQNENAPSRVSRFEAVKAMNTRQQGLQIVPLLVALRVRGGSAHRLACEPEEILGCRQACETSGPGPKQSP